MTNSSILKSKIIIIRLRFFLELTHLGLKGLNLYLNMRLRTFIKQGLLFKIRSVTSNNHKKKYLKVNTIYEKTLKTKHDKHKSEF